MNEDFHIILVILYEVQRYDQIELAILLGKAEDMSGVSREIFESSLVC
jgi:hypothetical protein